MYFKWILEISPTIGLETNPNFKNNSLIDQYVWTGNWNLLLFEILNIPTILIKYWRHYESDSAEPVWSVRLSRFLSNENTRRSCKYASLNTFNADRESQRDTQVSTSYPLHDAFHFCSTKRLFSFSSPWKSFWLSGSFSLLLSQRQELEEGIVN